MYTKTLGKENAYLFTNLAEQGKLVFSLADARAITGKNYQATLQALHRLIDAGWLVRLGGGSYAIVSPESGGEAIPTASRLVIGRELAGDKEHYLSHESALEMNDLLTRPITGVTITSVRRIQSRKILGVYYRFVFSKAENMWGYGPSWVGPSEQVQVSDLERTIIDGLNRPDLCGGISEVATAMVIGKTRIDWTKLALYASRINKNSVVKRLGYLSELLELSDPSIIEGLNKMISPSYAQLDPALPDEGRFLDRWKLQLNLDPEILEKVAST
jgi:predicted transcriptional regulator of viral defense system